MSFAFDASKSQTGSTPASNAPATTGMSGFTFGASGAGDAKNLSMSTPQAKPGGLFSGGLGATTPQATGFSFGTPTTTAVSAPDGSALPTQTPGLTFGTSATPTTNISFGTPNTIATTGFTAQTGSTTGFSLGSTTATTSATGLNFGVPKTTASTGFPLGGQSALPTGTSTLTFGAQNTPTTGFGFSSTPSMGTPTTTTITTATSFNISSNTTPLTSTLDASKKQTVTTTQSGFTGFMPGSTAATPASTGFALGTTITTSATPGFSFGGSTPATATSGYSIQKTTSTVTPASLATVTTASLGTTTTVSSSASGTQLGTINFCQLEESINKWTLELEELEKVFMNQAAQVNAWDKLLITNGEKIVTLNQEVERVKIEQQQLEHELDYVVGQQKELQDCLTPLEKELASLSVSDPEREYTYRLAENLDTQLKQMSEDLKEIIEHLNEANRTQDSSDPIVQIGKILNAHMNSLQWLDQRTALVGQKIQQIDQMHQNFRQEHERSFNLAYN